MSNNKSSLDSLWEVIFIYVFRKPIMIIGIILLVILVAGYYKFAVPVYKADEERMSNFNFEDEWVIDATTGEVVTYNEMNETRKAIARCLDDEGYVSLENKEKIEQLSESLIVNTLGRTYRLEEVEKDGKKCYRYYIGTIRMEHPRYAATFIDLEIDSKYKKDSKDQNIVSNTNN